VIERGERERRKPRATSTFHLFLGPIGPEIAAASEAVRATPALRVQGQAERLAVDPDVSAAAQCGGRTVHLDGHGVLARGREQPLARDPAGHLEPPADSGRGDAIDIADGINPMLTLEATAQCAAVRFPVALELTGCHLCSVYQVSGYAAILHKWV